MISLIVIIAIAAIISVIWGAIHEDASDGWYCMLLCGMIGCMIWIILGVCVPSTYSNIETYDVQNIDGITFYIDNNNNIHKIDQTKVVVVTEDIDTIQYRRYTADRMIFLASDKYELVIPVKAVEEA